MSARTGASDDPAALVRRARDAIDAHALNRGAPAWRTLRESVDDRIDSLASVTDAHALVRTMLDALGDEHSFLMDATLQTAMRSVPRVEPSGVPLRIDGRTIGILRVPAFTGSDPVQERRYIDTSKGFVALLDADAWIVDLRENGGGNMWPMLSALSPLLGQGTVGHFRDVAGNDEPWRLNAAGAWCGDRLLARAGSAIAARDHSDRPVAVLVGERTASSGEAIAVAFRGRADTIHLGGATAGLSTANTDFELPDGSTLFLTVATFVDRSGEAYGGRLRPDIVCVPAGSDSAVDTAVHEATVWASEACRQSRV